jgi:uncharacterized paraquat-inducible protein A
MQLCSKCEREFDLSTVSWLTGGIVKCPRCQARLRWQSKGPWLWLAEMALFMVTLPISFTVASFFTAFLVGPVMERWGFRPLFLLIGLLVWAGVLLGTVVGVHFSTRPWFRELKLSENQPQPSRRPGHCPVCLMKAGPDAIVFGDVKVCQVCKDEYAQRLREGVA